MRAKTRLAAATLAGALALAGVVLGACSASQDSGNATSNERAAPGAAPAGGVADGNAAKDAAAAPPAPQAAPGAPQQQQQAPAKIEPQERSLIYTGSIGVRVDNVVEAADKATDIAIGAGGVIAGDRRSLDGAKSDAQLTLRVPADKFTPVLD